MTAPFCTMGAAADASRGSTAAATPAPNTPIASRRVISSCAELMQKGQTSCGSLWAAVEEGIWSRAESTA
jgi:hypothetical protein